jgi:putative salt-induced outer membrane protein YdiY
LSPRQSLAVFGLMLLAVSSATLPAQGTPAASLPAEQPADLSAQPAAPAPPKPAPPPWVLFHGDLGFINTSGNTHVSTLNASDALTVWTSHTNKISQDFGTTYGTVSDKVQTSLWTASLRDDYTFTPVAGLYARFGFDRNVFAGIEQRFEQGVGAAVVPVNAGRNRLEIDLGVSYLEQRSTAAVELNYPAGRGAVIYRYTFAKDAYFQQSVDDLSDLNRFSNSLINSETDLVAPLSRHIAIKVGYQIRYSNEPPPGFKTTDRLLSTDLQFNI